MRTAGLIGRMTREQRDFVRKQIDARMRERLESARMRERRHRRVTRLAALDALESADVAGDPLVVLVQIADAVLGRTSSAPVGCSSSRRSSASWR